MTDPTPPPPPTDPMPRSPELMSRDDSALLVVDVQAKLVPLIPQNERMIWNIRRLVDAARLLNVPVRGTEQYPQGLGETVEPLRSLLKDSLTQSTSETEGDAGAPSQAVPSKTMFSCRECRSLWEEWADQGRQKVLVTGMETHVCVQQTVLDLISSGFRVFVSVDAVGARHELDHEIALRRMESAGATLTTTEAAIFEWCENARDESFKGISQLIRENPPV